MPSIKLERSLNVRTAPHFCNRCLVTVWLSMNRKKKKRKKKVTFLSRQYESHRARLKGKGWREGCWLEFLNRIFIRTSCLCVHPWLCFSLDVKLFYKAIFSQKQMRFHWGTKRERNINLAIFLISCVKYTGHFYISLVPTLSLVSFTAYVSHPHLSFLSMEKGCHVNIFFSNIFYFEQFT